MERVSVVLAPDGPVGDAVRELIGSWARAGITTPLVLVRASGVVESSPEPVNVSALVLDHDGEHRVDLFTYLGRYRLELVRIVVVQLLATADAADPELSRIGTRIADAVQAALPLAPDGRAVTRLHRSVLVVSASGVTGVPTGILLPDWDANVVISPEDRPDVDRPSIFVRASANLPGHAAAAVCAVAGVVRGVPDGALDAVATDSSTSATDVVVARVSIRTVIGEDVLDVLARRALDPAALAPVGPAQVVSSVIPASEPDLLVGRAARAVLTSSHWAPTPAPRQQEPERVVERGARSLGDAARFNLRSTAAVAAWTLSRGRDTIDSLATESIVGTGAGSIVTVGPRVLDQVDTVAEDVLERQRRELDERVAYEATRGAPPQPATWSQLRDLALALVDGSPLVGLDEPRQLGKREVLEPADVAPRPQEQWRFADGSVLLATDPHGMRAHRDGVAADLVRRRTDLQRLQLDLARLRADLEALRRAPDPVLPPPPEPVPAAGTDPVSTVPVPVEPVPTEPMPNEPMPTERVPAEQAAAAPATRGDHPLEPTRDQHVSELEHRILEAEHEDEHLRRGIEELARHESEYGAWFARASSSVLWRVGDDVTRRLDEHERSRRRFLETKDDLAAPVTAELERAKRRLLLLWWWTVPLCLAALAVLFWVAARVVEEPDWSTVGWIAAAIVLLALLVLILGNHGFYKAFRRYEFELARVLAQQRHATERYLWAGKELVRLRVLVAGWKDWTAILGEVVHRPWQPPAIRYEDLPAEIIERLPAAVAVARQADDQLELPPELVVSAYQELYQRGWASQAFGDAYGRFAAGLAAGESSGYLEVDTDVTSSPLGARGRLVEYWCSGRARQEQGERQRDRLRRLGHDGALALPERIVARIGPFSDEAQVAEPQYFAPTVSGRTTFALEAFGSRARSDNRHYVARTWLWLPAVARRRASAERLDSRERDEPGQPRAVGASRDSRAELLVREAAAATAVRIDVSRRLAPSALTLFQRAAAEVATRTDEPRFDAVVAPEPRVEVDTDAGRRARRPASAAPGVAADGSAEDASLQGFV